MEGEKKPFSCEQCADQPIDKFFRFEPVDDWMIFYPEKQIIHMHFGHATDAESLSTKETKWILDVQKQEMPKYAGTTFAVIADMTRADDSEFPSDASREMYSDIINHPQIGAVVFYGMAPGMTFFLNMLAQVMSKKVHAVNTREEADAIYEKWLAEQM